MVYVDYGQISTIDYGFLSTDLINLSAAQRALILYLAAELQASSYWSDYDTQNDNIDAMLADLSFNTTNPTVCPEVTVILPGTLIAYAGDVTTPPAGWLACHGQAVSRTTYADLFAVCGTTYGIGDGSTTFNLPDMQGRMAQGEGMATGESFARGISGGASRHTLLENEIPIHSHLQRFSNTGSGGGNRHQAQGAVATIQNESLTTGSAGGGQAHNNMPPYTVFNFLIKV